ncbi:unnamed protein product [Caenorhabditis brenneri]
MPVQSKFPILKLPLLAHQNVIRTMEYPERITASLCSKRLKRIVKSAITGFNRATIRIFSDYISIELYTSEDFDGEFIFEFEDNRKILSSQCSVYAEEDTHSWKIPTLTSNDWFRHLFEVYNCKSINVQLNMSGLNVKDLHVLIQGIPIKDIEVTEFFNDHEHSENWFHEALNTFYPAKRLQVYANPFDDRMLFHNIISRNYDTISLVRHPNYRCHTSIADILAMGSKSTCIFNPDFSVADLNALIRAWFNGWTPNLNLMTILCERDDPPLIERVFNGFECQKVEGRRSLRLTQEITHTIFVGYDIVRRDGVRATAAIDVKSAGTLVTLMIWS